MPGTGLINCWGRRGFTPDFDGDVFSTSKPNYGPALVRIKTAAKTDRMALGVTRLYPINEGWLHADDGIMSAFSMAVKKRR